MMAELVATCVVVLVCVGVMLLAAEWWERRAGKPGLTRKEEPHVHFADSVAYIHSHRRGYTPHDHAVASHEGT